MFLKAEARRTDRFDVVVMGAGPAGIAAAVDASRRGLSVAIVERSGCFGGNMTDAAVCQLLGGRRWDEREGRMVREVGGLFDEITDALIEEGDAIDPDTVDVHNYNPYGWYPRMAAGIPCDIEALKRKLDNVILGNGITPFLFTTLVGSEVENGKVVSAVCHDASGFRRFEAGTFIDATGDAELSYLSGCPVEKGREGDHLTTPATLIMHVDRVDLKEYVAYQNEHQQPKLIDIINRLREEGIWKFPYEIFIAIKLNEDDVCMVNTVRQIKIDGTDAGSLTDAMLDGRRQSKELLDIMRAYFPGFQNARMRFTANRIGIRESRRIVGRARTTYSDALDGRRYEDEVLRTTYNFDLPDPERPSFDPLLGSVSNPDATRKHIAIYAPYPVLLPQGVDNLLAVGRCISVDREVLGPMRVTGPSMLSGEAAGIAASLAKWKGISVSEIDGREVKAGLIEAGCLI